MAHGRPQLEVRKCISKCNPGSNCSFDIPSSTASSVLRFLYTRAARCTFCGLFHQQKVYQKVQSCERNRDELHSVIGRPWAPRVMHCSTNQPVCRMTTPFEIASPCSCPRSPPSRSLGNRHFPSENMCSCSGNSTRIGRFPSYSIKPPMVAKKP